MDNPDDNISVNMGYMSTRQLANRWNISLDTLGRWRVIGIGPIFLKLGSRIRYRLKDVEAYENNILRKSTSESVSGDKQWT